MWSGDFQSPCFDGKQITSRDPKNCNPGALGCRILSKLNGIFLNKLISEKIVGCSNCNGFCGCVCGSKKCVCPNVRRKKCPMTACCLPTAKGCLLTSHFQCPLTTCAKPPAKDNKTTGCCVSIMKKKKVMRRPRILHRGGQMQRHKHCYSHVPL